MTDLLLPWALGVDGKLCPPAEAVKGKGYVCPDCQQPVIFRRGEVNIPHFAHKADSGCTAESVLHKTAKLLIQQAVSEWKADPVAAPVVLLRRCLKCQTIHEQALPSRVESAQLEVRMPDGLIVDVALLSGGSPLAAVEILVTHAVDAEKAARLVLPWVELEGAAVLDNPRRWSPVQDRLRPWNCKVCERREEEERERQEREAELARIRQEEERERRKQEEEEARERQRAETRKQAWRAEQKNRVGDSLRNLVWDRVIQIAQETGIPPPQRACRVKSAKCWLCGEWMIVFLEPKSPGAPHSYLSRPSPQGKDPFFWNVCPRCGAKQPDECLEESGGTLWVEMEAKKVDG